MYSIVDLHMHVVPGVDDGAPNMGEALKMLKLAEQQGIVDIFCTSHNGYSKEDGENYLYAFNKLKDRVSQLGINIRLHKGCEILCAAEYIDEILSTASANMTIELDDEIVEAEAEAMYHDFMHQMSHQGITEEIYLQYAGTTKEDIISHMKEEAQKRLKNSYLLNAIIKKEKIEVSKEDAEKEIKEMAIKHNMTEEDVTSYVGGIDAMIYDLKVRRAIDLMKN